MTDNPPWRVGVLFSRSGPMQVSETEHFFGTALAIEEINRAGGVLGRPIEPVAYDPASDETEYGRLANRLLADDGVSVIFGCSTSQCRKAVLKLVERRNGLLWYPSLYEGFEFSPNVIYTGAAPNQTSIHFAAWLARSYGNRFYLVGSDYIYPRETNRIIRDLLAQLGGEVLRETYVPFGAGAERLPAIIADIAEKRPNVVFCTVVGSTAQSFYRLYHAAGLDATRMPIASLTMAEGEVRAIGPALCAGHVTAATYFSTIAGESNARFVASFRARFGADAPVSMWSQGAYTQVHLFARALARANSIDTETLVEQALGLEMDAPEGHVTIDPDNHHTWLRPRIGVLGADGDFNLVWEAKAPVRPDPYLTSYGPVETWLD